MSTSTTKKICFMSQVEALAQSLGMMLNDVQRENLWTEHNAPYGGFVWHAVFGFMRDEQRPSRDVQQV